MMAPELDVAAVPAREKTPLAIEHATVITMDGDAVLRDHTVIVEGERIAWLGPSAQATIAAGARRIDGRGKYVMPGLADMHAHPVTGTDLLLFLRYGVTSVRNMVGMPRHLRWRDAIARDELLAPSIHTPGPVVDGPPTMRAGSVPVETQAEATAAVTAVRETGYEAVKIYDHLTRAAYDAILAAGREQRFPIVGHIPFKVGLARALAAGQRSIEHLYGYIEAMQPQGSPLRECEIEPSAARQALADAKYELDDDRVAELVDLTASATTWNCPTLMIRRRHQQKIDELDARPEMRYVHSLRLERWRQFKLTYPYDLAHKSVELEVARRLIRALHARGAGLLIGTDAPVHYLVFGASLHEELEQFVRAGLTPHQVLAIATREAARFVGEDDVWGTLATGRRADVLLLDADPLEDIANAQRIAGIVLRGRWLDRATLESRLDDAVAKQNDTAQRAERAREPGASRFAFSWGSFALGTEDLSKSAGAGGDARRLRSDTALSGIAGRSEVGGSEGTYRSEVVFDDAGRAMSAKTEASTADGVMRSDLRRDGTRVVARTEGGFAPSREVQRDVADGTLLGVTDLTLYTELARRGRALGSGERATVELLGPGNPPDLVVLVTRIEIERTGDEISFSGRRPNGSFSGVLRVDSKGELAEVEIAARPSELGHRRTTGGLRDSASVPLLLRRRP